MFLILDVYKDTKYFRDIGIFCNFTGVNNWMNMERVDITKLRKEAGMSQLELAARLNIKPSFL